MATAHHASHHAPLRPLPGYALPQFTYSLGDVQARLGQQDRSTRWLLGYIVNLIGRHGFPAPLPLQHGDKVDCTPRGKSRWTATAVDAWFDAMLPCGNGASAAAERAAASDMDARAAALGLQLLDGGKQ